jgi:RNase P subunit RPR2
MDSQIFHGKIDPLDLSKALVAHFTHGNIRAQQFGSGNQIVVQISTTDRPVSGGQTALSVTIQKVEDGVMVKFGQQAWLGVAASLGATALAALRNPLNLLGRLDDLAQDFESIQLTDEVMKVVQSVMQTNNATYELSDRLKRMVCDYCNTANEVGASRCIACGAPLGDVQPRTCKQCGFVVRLNEKNCPNCGSILMN